VIVTARLGEEHVKDVARLHLASLTGLLSALGLPAVTAFYTGCVATGSAVGFVYLEAGAVRGFVLGSAHPDRLKPDALRRNPVGTLAGLCLGIMRRPSSLVWLLKSFRWPDQRDYDRGAAELTYLAVSGESRGAGIGRQLVDAFTDEIRNSGVEAYELSVDEDNEAAILFYQRLGFVLSGRYREFGVMHRRYRLELAGRFADTVTAGIATRRLKKGR
jgi:ribosomal protein S18 acetylase RimI-like enzyme